MQAEPNSLKDHPAYRFNELALQLGAYAALFSSGTELFAYGGNVGRQMAAADAALAVLFLILRHRLRFVRTPAQLDLVVTCAIIPTFLLHVWPLVLAPAAESPAGITCLIVTTGLLYFSTAVFLGSVFFGAAVWVAGQHFSGLEGSGRDLMHLFVTAPTCAVVVRLSARHVYASLTAERKLRRESEARLVEAQKNESLGLMAGGVAHDFNNVLQAINTFAEVIQATSAEPAIQETATQITKAASNAADICGQMLLYCGKSPVRREIVDVGSLANDLQALLKASVRENVSLRFECHSKVPLTVMANAGQIRQVLMNLVANAADATQPVGGNVSVSICERIVSDESEEQAGSTAGRPLTDGRYVAINVNDDGCGIDDETLALMFDPYFTTKPSGHGFGLAVVLGIVRTHGGTIHVHSSRDAETTITVLLPAVAPEKSEPEETAFVSEPAGRATERRILIVDDDDLVRRSLKQLLTGMQFDVTGVEDGAAAMELLQCDRKFDVILMDYVMPQRNGVQVTRELRRNGVRIPVILCSGLVNETHNPEIFEIFEGRLEKPFRSETLRSSIEMVLNRKTREGGFNAASTNVPSRPPVPTEVH
ncbi:MAG: response regulator [Planctomycetaceae bacterium]